MKELVLSAPGKNALTIATLESLRREAEEAGGEPILLTGAGDAFSAGLNLKEVASLDPGGMRRLLAALHGAVEALFTHPAPTVALVNGHAIAGGCVLALACDFRVAAADPRIRIGLNETAIGLPFPPPLLAMIATRLGPGSLRRVVLEAGLYPPAEARALGLVDEVAEDARASALAQLARLSAHPRRAYEVNKHLLHGRALDVPGSDRMMEEVHLPIWTSEEMRARVMGMLKAR